MSGRIRAHGKQENREGTEQSKETIRKYSSMSQNISVERDKHKTWMWRKSDVQQHPCIVIIIYQHLRTAAQKHLQADETLSKPQWTNYKNVIMEWKTGLCVPVAFCRCDCFIQLKQNEHTKTNEWPKKKKSATTATLCAVTKIVLLFYVKITDRSFVEKKKVQIQLFVKLNWFVSPFPLRTCFHLMQQSDSL